MGTKLDVPYRRQREDYICGPISLQMVLAYYGIKKPREELFELTGVSEKSGTTRKNMVRVAREHGLYTHDHIDATVREVQALVRRGVPVIVNYREPAQDEGHYAVVTGTGFFSLYIHDPYHGPYMHMSVWEFYRRWHGLHHTKNRCWILAASDKPFTIHCAYSPARVVPST